jgi:hypothetical protein
MALAIGSIDVAWQLTGFFEKLQKTYPMALNGFSLKI